MKIYQYIIGVFLVLSFGACDEDRLLEEPLDFLSPSNSFLNPGDIDAALVTIYGEVRFVFYGGYKRTTYLHSGTDLATGCRDPWNDNFGDYRVDLLPGSTTVQDFWTQFYGIIFNSNVILNRIEDIDYPSQTEKDKHIAEALFFRGFAYRCLVNLYGGVPLVFEETTSPRRDYIRATREATIDQAIEDLEFAAINLPGVTEVDLDGKANNAAALHILAELYITAGDFDKAITAATQVINDPNIALMTFRFGARVSDDGDAYWDLFQKDNQNRSSGNTEGILVLQTEFLVEGEDYMTFQYERAYGPLYWFLSDPDGNKIFIGATSKNGGRPVGFIRPSTYYLYNLWGDGNWDVDLRNHERNIKREWEVDNPSSAYLGQKISDFPQSWFDGLSEQDTLRDYFPYITKLTTMNDHPEELIDPSTGVMVRAAGGTITDWYLMRVAETYLLRAEAYLGMGNKTAAAADINVLRNRAKAIPVAEADVDIDYILDERMRELNFEEPRRMTLSRLNLLYDRTILGNPYSGLTVQPHNNLYPIPFAEIERNTLEVLEQNPGYTN